MIKLIVTVFFLSITSITAFPADNDKLDKKGTIKGTFYNVDKELSRSYRQQGFYLNKATINDVAVNTVSEEKKVEQTISPSSPQQVAPTSTIQISGITAGVNPSQASPSEDNTPFKPVRTGSMFARFIDDIFQIPIAVLQNVAKLISNPFTQRKTPEVVATVS